MNRAFAFGLIMVALAAFAAPARAEPGRPSCSALAGPALFASLTDAPTSVVTADYVAGGSNRPPVCAIIGYVAPTVGFVLWMPTPWNGKLLARGCGGFCGITAGEFACKDPVKIGYACVQTDMGHKSGLSDGVWARDNDEGRIDFGYRSTHVSTLAAKAIMAAYYGQAASASYFLGCSTGGRQGLVEAERFPSDFQGIVAIAPPVSETGTSIQITWSLLANRVDGHAILPSTKLAMLHEAVVADCDMNDGLKDGLIGDPALCGFDPASLLCKAGMDGPRCLTQDQIAVANRIYRGPENELGLPFFTGGAPLGSEGHWAKSYIGEGSALGPFAGLVTEFWRYLGFPESSGADWTLDRFDFATDPMRTGAMETLYGAGDPDLRAFKALGGRLILAQGLTDDVVTPGGTIDFYRGVTRFMGGEAPTAGFARLFLIPGMNHCTGGEGAYAIDYVDALDHWVRSKQPPERLLGVHPKDGVTVPYLGVAQSLAPDEVAFQRPIYAFPSATRYRGGDPDDAQSWAPH